MASIAQSSQSSAASILASPAAPPPLSSSTVSSSGQLSLALPPAAIAVLFVIVLQILLTKNEVLEPNAGFIQYIGSFFEYALVWDLQWVMAYTQLRKNVCKGTVRFMPDSIVKSKLGTGPVWWLWLIQTFKDIWIVLCALCTSALRKKLLEGNKARLSKGEIEKPKQSRSKIAAGKLKGEEPIEPQARVLNKRSRPETGADAALGTAQPGESDAGKEQTPSIHLIQLWWRSYRAFYRSATILEWKIKYHFSYEERKQDPETGLDGGPKCKRLPTPNESILYHRLDAVEQRKRDRVEELLGKSDKMLIIYGLSVVEIPEEYACAPKDLVRFQQAATTLTCGLICIAAALCATIWTRYAFIGLIAVPITAICQWKCCQQSAKQITFCAEVGRRVAQIERACTYLFDEHVGPNMNEGDLPRPLDILICYQKTRAWCRCQTASPKRHGIWVELMIPTTSPWTNRIYGLLTHAVRTILPWGHSNHWEANLLFAVITASCSAWAGDVRAALVSLIVPWLAKLLMPRSRLGGGENWTVAWYTVIFEWLTGGAASALVVSAGNLLALVSKQLLGIPSAVSPIPTAILSDVLSSNASHTETQR